MDGSPQWDRSRMKPAANSQPDLRALGYGHQRQYGSIATPWPYVPAAWSFGQMNPNTAKEFTRDVKERKAPGRQLQSPG